MPAPQRLVDEIMDWFDFGKVEEVMQALDWEWFGAEEGVPNQAELRIASRNLLNSAWDDSVVRGVSTTHGSGGFYAKADAYQDYLELNFVVASWETLS